MEVPGSSWVKHIATPLLSKRLKRGIFLRAFPVWKVNSPKALHCAERGALLICLYHLRDDPSMVKGRKGLSIKSLVTLKPSFVLQTPLSLLLPPSPCFPNPVSPVVHTELQLPKLSPVSVQGVTCIKTDLQPHTHQRKMETQGKGRQEKPITRVWNNSKKNEVKPHLKRVPSLKSLAAQCLPCRQQAAGGQEPQLLPPWIYPHNQAHILSPVLYLLLSMQQELKKV